MTKKHIGAFTEACLLSFIASNILFNCFLSGPMYDKTLTGVKKKPGKSGPACDRTMKTSRTLIRIRIRTLGKFWWMHTLTQFLHIILLSFLYPALAEYVSFIMQTFIKRLHIRCWDSHPPPGLTPNVIAIKLTMIHEMLVWSCDAFLVTCFNNVS